MKDQGKCDDTQKMTDKGECDDRQNMKQEREYYDVLKKIQIIL